METVAWTDCIRCGTPLCGRCLYWLNAEPHCYACAQRDLPQPPAEQSPYAGFGMSKEALDKAAEREAAKH